MTVITAVWLVIQTVHTGGEGAIKSLQYVNEVALSFLKPKLYIVYFTYIIQELILASFL